MLKKLMASGIAAKVIQEARKPENQAKIKQAIADFQAKRASQATPPRHPLSPTNAPAPARIARAGAVVRPADL